MKYLTITLVLLLFELTFSTEHTLNNIQAIEEDDKDSREWYRPFTNAHALQFLTPDFEENIDTPDAPILPELNVDGLPKYIRSAIAIERPERRSPQIVKRSDSNKTDNFVQTPQALPSSNEQERHAPRTYGLNLTDREGYVWNDLNKNPGVYYEVSKPEDGEIQPKQSANGKGSKKPTSLNNLLNDDHFWKWLSQWTEFYFDVLAKNIERQIKEEVAKQLSGRPHSENESDKSEIGNKNENSINININTDKKEQSTVPKDIKIYINGKEIVTNASEIINTNESQNIESPENNKEYGNKNSSLEDAHNNPINIIINSDGKEHENGPQNDEEDIKIFIKGREIAANASQIENNKDIKRNRDVATNASDSEPIDLTKGRLQKYKPGNNEQNSNGQPISVDGETIYGNSIGNDKVTNIFIFYPKENDNNIIKELIYNSTKNDDERNNDSSPQAALNLTENVRERDEKYININETSPITDIDIRTGEE